MSVRYSNPHQKIEIDPNQPKTLEERRILKVFRKYDTDGDGYLSINELKTLVKENPEQCKDLPERVIEHLHKDHDENNDGQLDYNEFLKLSRKINWTFNYVCTKYCELIFPPPIEVLQKRKFELEHPEGYDTSDLPGDYEKQVKWFPLKVTMIIISFIEVTLFFADQYYIKDQPNDVTQAGKIQTGHIFDILSYNGSYRNEFWRFVTYMFVHGGVMHLTMNLFIQIFLGIGLEIIHCWWRVVLIYLAGVLAGSIGVSIVNPGVVLIGASAGVYALITAHLASIILNWHEMKYGFYQLAFFLGYIIVDAYRSAKDHIANPSGTTSHIAHLCGGFAGLLVGILVLRNLEVKSYEKKIWWVALIIYFLLMISGICIHIFVPSRFPSLITPGNIPSRSSV